MGPRHRTNGENLGIITQRTQSDTQLSFALKADENDGALEYSRRILDYPELRYMGSKRRLLPWIQQTLDGLDFESALDPFAGSGCVAYLLKCLGRRVIASDFLNFSATLARATIENRNQQLGARAVKKLLGPAPAAPDFIERTYAGIFYTREDLQFLDRVSANIRALENHHQQALAKAALFRSCLKRQPRGVFTVSGNRYNDGRRDLRLSLEEHFIEQLAVFNKLVFDNGHSNSAMQADVFTVEAGEVDLVYLDPPYVPRSDDNCYIKRYHFLEGLSCYWEGLKIDHSTKVRKIPKRFTPFSYRHTAYEAFNGMFARFAKQKIVLSYSSNGYPDLDHLTDILGKTKKDIRVFKRDHRYHFGTHNKAKRSSVEEYLIVGQ